MERVSQFYLFVEESVILTHIYFTFFTIKKIQECLKMNINAPFILFPLGEILSLMENLWAIFKFKLKK